MRLAVGSKGVRAPMIGMFSRSSVLVRDCSGYCASRIVAVRGLWVQPIVWRESQIRADAGNHIDDDTILRNPVVGGFRPIHIDVQFGIALALLDPHIDGIRDLGDSLLNLFCYRPNDIEAAGPSLEYRSAPEAEVQHIADDAAGLECDLYTGQFFAQTGFLT